MTIAVRKVIKPGLVWTDHDGHFWKSIKFKRKVIFGNFEEKSASNWNKIWKFQKILNYRFIYIWEGLSYDFSNHCFRFYRYCDGILRIIFRCGWLTWRRLCQQCYQRSSRGTGLTKLLILIEIKNQSYTFSLKNLLGTVLPNFYQVSTFIRYSFAFPFQFSMTS